MGGGGQGERVGPGVREGAWGEGGRRDCHGRLSHINEQYNSETHKHKLNSNR